MKAIEKVLKATKGRRIPEARALMVAPGFGIPSEGVPVVFPVPGTRAYRELADAFRACGIHMGLVTVAVNGQSSVVDCSIYPSRRHIAAACGVLEA